MAHKKFYLPISALLLLLLTQHSSAQLSNSKSTSPFPQCIIDEMSKREMRYMHFLWHNIRDNWNRFDANFQQEIREYGWEPPRPAREYVNGSAIALTENDSGEDFFYMHRQMIAHAKQIMIDHGAVYELTGWTTLPAPGDPDWPVSETYEVPGSPTITETTATVKTDDYYYNTMKPIEDTFANEDVLRNMTLGQLGSAVENTIHNWLHLRFSSASSYGYRPGTIGGFPYIDQQWDNKAYNWLGDTYASHVHPTFWKIHIWVDNILETWKNANGIDEIQWKGTWIGGPMDSLAAILDLYPNTNSHDTNSQDTSSQNEGENVQIMSAQAVEEEEEEEQSNDIQVEYSTSSTHTVDNTGIPDCSFADPVEVNLAPVWTVVSQVQVEFEFESGSP